MAYSDQKSMHDLTTGSIPRHLLRFALPMLVGNLLQVSYSIVNSIWVGRYLGSNALAAVAVGFPAVFLLIGIGAGLTMATSILIAQYCGAKNWAQVKRVVQSSTSLIFGLSLLLMIIGELTAPTLLRMINTPPAVMPIAQHYLRLYLLMLPCGFGFFLISSMLRGAGDSMTPLKFMAVSLLTTAILDPLLMLGWLGFPRLGLNGTAVATIIAQATALLALIIHLERTHHLVAPDWLHLGLDWETVWLTMKIGVPSVVQQLLVSIGTLFVQGFVNGFGAGAVAAFLLASRYDQIAFFPAMTIGMAVATLTGQNIGAHKHQRVNEVFRWGLLLSCSITLLVSATAVFAPYLLLRLFTNDAQVIAIGTRYLRVVGACYVLFSVTFVSNGVINGSGHTFMTTLISLISLWVVRVPLAWLFTHWLHRVDGIWYAMSISFATSMLIGLGYYYSGRWRKAIIKPDATPILAEMPEAEVAGETEEEPPQALNGPLYDACPESE